MNTEYLHRPPLIRLEREEAGQFIKATDNKIAPGKWRATTEHTFASEKEKEYSDAMKSFQMLVDIYECVDALDKLNVDSESLEYSFNLLNQHSILTFVVT